MKLALQRRCGSPTAPSSAQERRFGQSDGSKLALEQCFGYRDGTKLVLERPMTEPSIAIFAQAILAQPFWLKAGWINVHNFFLS